MSTSPDANELLDRAAAQLQSQSTLIETLLLRCKDLHNDAEILRGTVKATVAERDKALANLTAMTRKAEDAEVAGWRMLRELDNTSDENAKAAREIEELRAKLQRETARADHNHNEWVTVDSLHKCLAAEIRNLKRFIEVAFNRAPRVEKKTDGFWLILSNVTIRVPEPRDDIGYKALVDAIEQQKQDRVILNFAGLEVSS